MTEALFKKTGKDYIVVKFSCGHNFKFTQNIKKGKSWQKLLRFLLSRVEYFRSGMKLPSSPTLPQSTNEKFWKTSSASSCSTLGSDYTRKSVQECAAQSLKQIHTPLCPTAQALLTPTAFRPTLLKFPTPTHREVPGLVRVIWVRDVSKRARISTEWWISARTNAYREKHDEGKLGEKVITVLLFECRQETDGGAAQIRSSCFSPCACGGKHTKHVSEKQRSIF